jgi:hypothetical protein
MSIIVASAFDEKYPWGQAFTESARKHHPDVVIFDVGGDVDRARAAGKIAMPRPMEVKNGCPQHGAFLEHGDFSPLDVVIFGDGDMVMQRPFSVCERAELHQLPLGVVLAGENQPGWHSLLEEANLLQAKAEGWVVDELFPGWRELPIWNTGLLAARAATWQRLYDTVRGLLPVGFALFDHYATQQWVISYAMGKWFQRLDLPRTICCHGLAGPVAGMTEDAEGNVYWEGTKAVFRHAINLTPPKAVQGLPRLA